MNTDSFDVLALAAHRDDVEQTCGGTLLKMAERGYRTAILDLTQGEMGTRGTAEDRACEAAEAAQILKVSKRVALDIPDGRVENTWENRLKVAQVIRDLRPRVLILPYWQGRHPDHYTASVLGYEACFLAGLSKLDTSSQLAAVSSQVSDSAPQRSVAEVSDRQHQTSPEGTKQESPGRKPGVQAANDRVPGGRHPDDPGPHRPFKIIYASLYFDVRPTFVVDITEQFETRFASLMAYKSQFRDQEAGARLFPAEQEIRSRVESMARFYGMLGGVTYAEPFVQKEVGLVDDLMAIPVKSI